MMNVQVSVLKARLSQYVEAVAAGETIVVTERGKPVAMLCPLHRTLRDASTIDRLASIGLARPPYEIMTDSIVDAGQPVDLTGVMRKALLKERRPDRVDGRFTRHFTEFPDEPVPPVPQMAWGRVAGSTSTDDQEASDDPEASLETDSMVTWPDETGVDPGGHP